MSGTVGAQECGGMMTEVDNNCFLMRSRTPEEERKFGLSINCYRRAYRVVGRMNKTNDKWLSRKLRHTIMRTSYISYYQTTENESYSKYQRRRG